MADDLVKILDGNTFVVSDSRGDIEASLTDPTGLFSFDTRFLSKWVLTVNGDRLNSLSVDDMQYFESRFFLVPGTGTVYVDANLSVIRRRSVDAGFEEEIAVLNHDNQPVKLAIRIDAGCDFADLFEVKDALRKKGKFSTRVERSRLVLEYARDTYRRYTTIAASGPAKYDEKGLAFAVTIPAHGEWQTTIAVTTGLPTLEAPTNAARRSKPDMRRDLDRWLEAAPKLKADSADLERTYRRSLVDLAALRFSPLSASGRSLPAAGLPWFMTMFGRDSLFTSLQALPFNSELAATTLRELGLRQGTRIDDFRDEDPGRILHEMRYGEMTAFGERPHSPYFGNADATPLFVVLLDEYERWTGDTKLVRELEYEARAALNWIDEYANLRGDGYIWYQRRNEKTGLENQCWKDSWDSISSRDGTIPGFPRATCELQGYAYDAKMRAAAPRPHGLEGRRVRRRPREASRGSEAPLQPRLLGRRRRVLRARARRERRTGRRTLVEQRPPAVERDRRQVEGESRRPTPHGTSPVLRLGRSHPRRAVRAATTRSAITSARSGRSTTRSSPGDYGATASRQKPRRSRPGILDAAAFFDGRLPEAFGGYPRNATKYPVQYPTACSPQAWSTGTPLLLLRTMLGLEPTGDHLIVDPLLPEGMGQIELLDIPGRWGRIDAFARER